MKSSFWIFICFFLKTEMFAQTKIPELRYEDKIRIKEAITISNNFWRNTN